RKERERIKPFNARAASTNNQTPRRFTGWGPAEKGRIGEHGIDYQGHAEIILPEPETYSGAFEIVIRCYWRPCPRHQLVGHWACHSQRAAWHHYLEIADVGQMN